MFQVEVYWPYGEFLGQALMLFYMEDVLPIDLISPWMLPSTFAAPDIDAECDDYADSEVPIPVGLLSVVADQVPVHMHSEPHAAWLYISIFSWLNANSGMGTSTTNAKICSLS